MPNSKEFENTITALNENTPAGQEVIVVCDESMYEIMKKES
jgi:hypothetical protein